MKGIMEKYFTNFVLHTMYLLKFLFLFPLFIVKQYQYFSFHKISLRFRSVTSHVSTDWHSIYMHSDYTGSYFSVQFTSMVFHLSKQYKTGKHALVYVDYASKGLLIVLPVLLQTLCRQEGILKEFFLSSAFL